MNKFKHRAKSWKELSLYGNQTEEGLYLPMGIYGLSDTKIIFDEDDENEHQKELAVKENKKQRGKILSIGLM